MTINNRIHDIAGNAARLFHKNVAVGQSGGPTAAINASLAGVYSAAKALGAGKVYGMVHGIQGFLEGDLVDMEAYIGEAERLELLKRTPASFLGTCRYKLPEEGAVYEKIFRVMDQYRIEAFFYIGGNDSMDTIRKLADYGRAMGRSERFVGIPKTVDNDLPITDHCPGYGSAAKYIAASLKEVIRDVESTGLTQPTVLLVEIMGRHAGWLTAAAALARGEDCSGADAIYLPERVFDPEECVKYVKELGERKRTIVLALSEGIRLADGRFVCELTGTDGSVDVFGHKQLSGCGKTLAAIIKERTGYKTRAIELSTLQRAASHLASATDIEEAFAAGEAGAEAALRGESGVMVVMRREAGEPYSCRMETYDIHSIANVEKTVPPEWITEDGRGVTGEFLEYCRPLIQGELRPIFRDGLPAHLVRN